MADINIREKLRLEKFFEMEGGYVLDFLFLRIMKN